MYFRILNVRSEQNNEKSLRKHWAQFTCSNQLDCIPSSINSSNIPEELIGCVGTPRRCNCSECFQLYNDTCQLKDCWSYDATSNCTDNRRSQLEAILLSACLSSVGAANFYIGRNILGKYK